MIADGTASLCLRGEASFTRTDAEGSATLANLELDIRPGAAGDGGIPRAESSGKSRTAASAITARRPAGPWRAGAGCCVIS